MRSTTGEGRPFLSGFTSALTASVIGAFTLASAAAAIVNGGGATGGGAFAQAAAAAAATIQSRVNLRWRTVIACMSMRPRSTLSGAAFGFEAGELLFVGRGEFLPEELTKAGLGVLDHITNSFAVQVPVPQLRRHAEQRA